MFCSMAIYPLQVSCSGGSDLKFDPLKWHYFSLADIPIQEISNGSSGSSGSSISAGTATTGSYTSATSSSTQQGKSDSMPGPSSSQQRHQQPNSNATAPPSYNPTGSAAGPGSICQSNPRPGSMVRVPELSQGAPGPSTSGSGGNGGVGAAKPIITHVRY